MRVFGPEQVMGSGYWTGKSYPEIASGQCSSPGSGYNSGHNSVGGICRDSCFGHTAGVVLSVLQFLVPE